MSFLEFKDKTRRVLIFLQRYTKTDNIYLAKGGFWIILAGVASNILGIILAVAFTRLSTQVIYGQYQFILALIDTLMVFSLPSINTAVTEAVVRGQDQSVILGIKKRLEFSLAGSLIFLAVAFYFYFFKPIELLAAAFLGVSLFFPVHNISGTVFAYYYAKKEFRLPQIMHVIMRFLIVTSLVLAIMVWNNIFAIITSYLIVNGLMNVALVYYFRKTQELKGGVDSGIVRYGVQLTLANIVPELLNNTDKLIIPIFLNVEALAIYTIAEKIPNVIKGFFKSVKTIFFPKLVYLSKENFLAKFRNLYLISFFVVAIFLTIILLPWIIPLLFGSGYQDSIFIAQIYSLITLPFIFQDIISDWFQAKKNVKYYFLMTNIFVIGTAVAMCVALLLYRSLIFVVLARIIVICLVFTFSLRLVKKS